MDLPPRKPVGPMWLVQLLCSCGSVGLPWRSISAKLLALTGVPALLAIVCFAVIRYLLSMLYSMRKVWPLPFDQFSVTGVVGVSLLPLGVQTVAGPGASTPCTDKPGGTGERRVGKEGERTCRYGWCQEIT